MIPAEFDYPAPGSIEERGAGRRPARREGHRRRPEPAAADEAAPRTADHPRGHRAHRRAQSARATRRRRAEIGALTTYAQVMDETQLEWARDAVANIGDVQVRNRGTIGGSVAHADPASDVPAILLVLDYSAVLRSSRGERVVPLDGFFTGPFTTRPRPTRSSSQSGAATARRRWGRLREARAAGVRVRDGRRGRGHRAKWRLDQPRTRRADRGRGPSVPGEGGGVGARRLGRLCLGDRGGRGARHRWRIGQFGHPRQFDLSFSDGHRPYPSRDRDRPRPQRLRRRTGTGAPRTSHARPARARPSCRLGPRPRPEGR